MGDLSLTHYIVRRESDRWLFVPSTLLAGMMTLGFGAGSAFMFYISSLFFRHAIESPTILVGPTLLIAGSIFAAWAIRAWRTRRTPLTVESGGRVSYGDHELCAPGTVRSVRIVEARGGEAGDCDVVIELADERMVCIPSQYFGSFRSRDHARPFAAKLAEALSVPVTEQS